MAAPYMVTPFKAVGSGVKDAFNFYQSQLRINIECAFGMLVNRWAILRTPIPLHISIQKTTSMVRSLCCLHNWLIDEKISSNIPECTAEDALSIISRGGDLFNKEFNLNILLGGGHHFDDNSKSLRYNKSRKFLRSGVVHPREKLIEILNVCGVDKRPNPIGMSSTNI